MTTLTLGFSPCPNDTFLFDALCQRNDTSLTCNLTLIADVENSIRVLLQELTPPTLSHHALGHLLPYYELLNAGSALGIIAVRLLIAKEQLNEEEVNAACIAIPGNIPQQTFYLDWLIRKRRTRNRCFFRK